MFKSIQTFFFAECRGMVLSKGGLCRVPRIRHSAKRALIFFKKFPLCRVPSQGTRQRHLKKIKSLPSAVPGALGKVFFLKKFSLPSARSETLGKEFKKKIKSLPSARSGTLGKEFFFKKIQIFAECLTAGTQQRRP